MEKIKIIVDTISNISKEMADKYDIGVFSFKLILDDKTYTDMVDMSREEFFEKLVRADEAHTATPSPEEFKIFIKEFIDQGYNKFLVYATSSGLTGMYNMMRMTAEEIKEDYGVEIEVIDTKSAYIQLTFAAVELSMLVESGASFEEVKDKAYKNLDKLQAQGVMRSLKYLIKGGRAPKALLGRVLSELMYPLLSIKKDGALTLEKMEIGRTRSLRAYTNMLREDLERHKGKRFCLGLTYGMDRSEFDKVKEQLKDYMDEAEIYLEEPLTSALAVHIGPDCLGYTIYPLD
ncbi:MAG: DegV family protein [Finegoldia sp.]|nr:DegV family protein [Finegoldia sp.]